MDKDLLDEAMNVALKVTGLDRMDPKEMRRFPGLLAAVVQGYATLKAARVISGQAAPELEAEQKPEPTEGLPEQADLDAIPEGAVPEHKIQLSPAKTPSTEDELMAIVPDSRQGEGTEDTEETGR